MQVKVERLLFFPVHRRGCVQGWQCVLSQDPPDVARDFAQPSFPIFRCEGTCQIFQIAILAVQLSQLLTEEGKPDEQVSFAGSCSRHARRRACSKLWSAVCLTIIFSFITPLRLTGTVSGHNWQSATISIPDFVHNRRDFMPFLRFLPKFRTIAGMGRRSRSV